MRNRGVACVLAGAALGVAAGPWWLGGWAWLLLWPGTALAVHAAAYAGRGPAVFRKSNGRQPWTLRILLAPCLLAARIIVQYRCLGLAPYARATPAVWVGRMLTDAEAIEIRRKGVTAVVDLTTCFPESVPLRSLTYCNVQLLPLTLPTLDQLQDAVRFIQAQSQRGIVYVHGAAGHSRSAGIAAAYLLAAGLEPEVERAVNRLRAVAPQTRLDGAWMRRLHEFEAARSRQLRIH